MLQSSKCYKVLNAGLQKDSDQVTSRHQEGLLKIGRNETKVFIMGYFRPTYLILQYFDQINSFL